MFCHLFYHIPSCLVTQSCHFKRCLPLPIFPSPDAFFGRKFILRMPTHSSCIPSIYPAYFKAVYTTPPSGPPSSSDQLYPQLFSSTVVSEHRTAEYYFSLSSPTTKPFVAGKQRHVRLMPKACLEMEGVEFFKVDAKAAMLFCTGPIRQGASTCLCVAMKRSVDVL